MPPNGIGSSKARLKLRRIVDVVEHMDITESEAWAELDVLSTRTHVDGLQVDPEGVIIDGKNFRGLVNVYVLLSYGDGDDSFETSDGFMGFFNGHFEGDEVKIDKLTVDTSSFYEGTDLAATA